MSDSKFFNVVKIYCRKYVIFFVAGIIFLFAQSLADLSLPSLMSAIVNVGITQSGINNQSPPVILPEVSEMLTKFMTPPDVIKFRAVYVPLNSLPEKSQSKLLTLFPQAAEKQVIALTPAIQNRNEINIIYQRACYALTNAVTTQAKRNFSSNAVNSANAGIIDKDSNSKYSQSVLPNIDELQKALPNLSAAEIGNAVTIADKVPELTTMAATAQWNRLIYQELGVDLAWLSISYIIRIGALMIFIGVLSISCAFVTAFCFSQMGSGIAADLRNAAMTKTMSFTNVEIDQFTPSGLLTRITSDTTNVQNFFAGDLRNIFYAPVLAIGGLVFSYHVAPSLCWTIYPLFGLLAVIMITMLIILSPRFKLAPKLIDKMNHICRENLNGVMVIRAFGNETFHSKRFQDANLLLTQNNLVLLRMQALSLSILMLLMNLFTVGITWIGAEKIVQFQMQIGDLLAFIQYIFLIIGGFVLTTLCLVNLPSVLISVSRLSELLKTVPAVQDPIQPVTLKKPVRGEIRFENVCFRYGNADEDTLHDITFTAKSGQTTAIIGATGSGKTTLVNLLLRFYDPTSGTIFLDETDIRQLKQFDFRRQIGYVPQQSKLFSGTIEENLRWGKTDADIDVLNSAAETAQIRDFIEHLPDGFKSIVSQSGSNFSGGQRQRLAIARALTSQSPIYIFDDSFSALDYLTDAKLRKSLVSYAKDATLIIVAQRISTIRNAEQIIVLDKGKIAGCGVHGELLRHCLIYREIAESQNMESENNL
ncbi:MAG: ABC transporter ATP-binding protein/permease [Planctomycetaceae bacterium]|jgi:ATP-binding cassette subfamily B protein|nr:ABC transporter ATP-binding protein/permease [Planctomycetaceae bacterium]